MPGAVELGTDMVGTDKASRLGGTFFFSKYILKNYLIFSLQFPVEHMLWVIFISSFEQ